MSPGSIHRWPWYWDVTQGRGEHDDCCQDCRHDRGQLPTKDGRRGTSLQRTATPRQSWTICPQLRIRRLRHPCLLPAHPALTWRNAAHWWAVDGSVERPCTAKCGQGSWATDTSPIAPRQ